MKQIKVAEATGPALDWLVGDIEFKRLLAQGSHVKQWVLEDHNAGINTDPWSSDWIFGGPIIDREGIRLDPPRSTVFWSAEKDGYLMHGRTPLIAAMLCYVASKLGETAEVPEELA